METGTLNAVILVEILVISPHKPYAFGKVSPKWASSVRRVRSARGWAWRPEGA